MPDPGVHLYVRDVLREDFGVDVDCLPEHWIPLAIVGTLDWVVICGWWLYRNTGIFESDEQYKWVYRWANYEFDPDELLVFKENPERHKFQERLERPGITGKERTEALQFLFRDVFEMWYRNQRSYTPEQAENFFPPQEFIELTMYATFLWILDDYGRDWIYMQDEVFACVFDFSVAYLSTWEDPPALLDPKEMSCTKRKLNSCAACGEVLHCVGGSDFKINDTSIDHPVVQAILRRDDDTVQPTLGRWAHLCNNCAFSLALIDGVTVDEYDPRLHHPSCPHLKGVDGVPGNCKSTCPHSGMNPEKVWEMMEEAGSERLRQYRERVESLGGRSPRMVAGQTVEDIVNHFRQERGDGTPFSRSRRRLVDDS